MNAPSLAVSASPEVLQKITIYNDHVEADLPNGVKKAISLTDFKTAIDKGLNTEAAQADPVFLPSNCFVFAKSLATGMVQCYYAERTLDVFYMDKKTKFTIPFPNVIITHTMSVDGDNWKRTDTKFFATDKRIGQIPLSPILKEDFNAHIWTLPMPNMYQGGGMCYGRNTLISMFAKNNLRGLDWFYKILYSSPYNSDLTVPSLKNQVDPHSWLLKLSEQKKYPYNLLRGYNELGEAVTEDDTF